MNDRRVVRLAEDNAESLQRVHLAGYHAGSSRTSVDVAADSLNVGPTYPGYPVAADCKLVRIAVSWQSASTPSGAWTLTFWRRTGGGSFNAETTFTVETS